nr:MAG TPA: hypothetical protein [Caudoviricetes sp.]
MTLLYSLNIILSIPILIFYENISITSYSIKMM